ncbi:hypothetical protein BDW62DRAFT_188684 [Aspergillus aurantiobrunneus]
MLRGQYFGIFRRTNEFKIHLTSVRLPLTAGQLDAQRETPECLTLSWGGSIFGVGAGMQWHFKFRRTGKAGVGYTPYYWWFWESITRHCCNHYYWDSLHRCCLSLDEIMRVCLSRTETVCNNTASLYPASCIGQRPSPPLSSPSPHFFLSRNAEFSDQTGREDSGITDGDGLEIETQCEMMIPARQLNSSVTQPEASNRRSWGMRM